MQLPSKSTRRKTKGNMHFLFLLFCSNKRIAKDSDCFKKEEEEEEYIHGKQTYSNKQFKVWDLLKYLDRIEIKWVI